MSQQKQPIGMPFVPYYRPFAESLVRIDDLSGAEVRLLLLVANLSWGTYAGPDGVAHLSMTVAVKETSLSLKSVRRAVRSLLERKLIEQVSQPTPTTPGAYRINRRTWDEIKARCSEGSPVTRGHAWDLPHVTPGVTHGTSHPRPPGSHVGGDPLPCVTPPPPHETLMGKGSAKPLRSIDHDLDLHAAETERKTTEKETRGEDPPAPPESLKIEQGVNGPSTPSEAVLVIEACHRAYRQLCDKPFTARQQQGADQLQDARRRPGVQAADVVAALAYAVALTQHESRTKKISNRWAYAVSVALDRIPEAMEHRRAAEWAASVGRSPPRPFKFVPEEVTHGT